MTVLRCTRDLSIDKISENKEMEVKCANKLIVMSNIRTRVQGLEVKKIKMMKVLIDRLLGNRIQVRGYRPVGAKYIHDWTVLF